ncbi:MraZ protein [Ruminococcus sp. YRD2003]|uniref:division/cell wall cluster transcriptional repressor MraZ n=1 Tax=Ruminococcus sp. YRD2003 TaxID=1452313 RepID=UPI0008B8E2E6|nr:MraZ protein [Ruminococcus flavefaciens]
MRQPLCGTFNPSIDSKGRMSFPSKLRDILGGEFYLCLSHDKRYIAAFSIEDFDEYARKLFELGTAAEPLRREVLAGAEKQTPDAQGRIFISQKLREKAGITGDVTVIGNYNKAEIWASDRLEAAQTEVNDAEMKALLATIAL